MYTNELIKSEIAEHKLTWRKVEYVVKNGIKRSVTSDVWQQFYQIFEIENNNDIRNWFICLRCEEPIENVYAGGTTVRFHRHNKICRGIVQGQRKIDDFYGGKPAKRAKLSDDHTNKLSEAIVQFVANDLRPYSAIEGKGMARLLVTAFELGKVHPKMAQDDFVAALPGRRTVQRAVESKAHNVREMIAHKLKEARNSCGAFSSTVDLWTDNYRQKCYMTITAHLNRLEFDKIAHDRLVIEMKEIEDERKTRDVVEREIYAAFNQYGLTNEQVESDIHFVSDRGAQFKAMTAFKRSNCFAHLENNVVEAMCKESKISTIVSDAW